VPNVPKGWCQVLVLLLVATSAFAQTPAPDVIDADRPGLADTSTVVGKGWLQLETGLQWESRTGETSFYIPTLFRIGVSNRAELRLEGNTITSVHPEGQTAVSGLAPFSLGFEFAALEPNGRHQPGIGMIARLVPAWGSGEFRASRVTGDVRLALDWDFAPDWSLNPNAGIGWYESADGRFAAALAALTLSYSPKPRANMFIDVGIQQPEVGGGTASAIVDGGVAFFLGSNWQFDISTGARVHGETGPRPFIAVGFAVRNRLF
jgi:hypothetical protein